MPQYTSQTTQQPSGIVVTTVLDTQTNQITYTVATPTGQTATATLPSNRAVPTSDLIAQLRAAGRTGGITIGSSLSSGAEDVKFQASRAEATATATNTSVAAAPNPPVPAIKTPEAEVPAVAPNAAPAAQQANAALDAPGISVTSNDTFVPGIGDVPRDSALATLKAPAPFDDPSAGTGFGDDDTTVFDGLPRGPQDPTGVLAAEDQAIAEQQAAQSDADAFAGLATVQDPTGVLAAEDAALAAEAAAQSDAEAFGPTTFGPTPPPPGTGFGDDQEEFTTDSLGNTFRNGELYRAAEAEEDISQRDSFKVFANQQATLRARYQEPSSQDWRVRLVLAGSADYLYQDDNNTILKPLQDANGVIFPYTPQISTSYNAGYDETQLTHSNYRGYFYKGSYVGDINITATFTAQDTREAQYLLAVIHFFRSVTKMFYGQDAQRGTPPPLVYLIGLGEYQFNGHACLLSQFSYNLPADVDYIRATGFNNYGVNLLNRRAQASQGFPGSSLLGTTARLLASKLLGFPGAEPARPAPGPVTGGVNNTVRSTYVPTKMEIQLVLKPVQSRAQMSREFSLKNFANGNLLKGGYW
jgi:hypothetical protein